MVVDGVQNRGDAYHGHIDVLFSFLVCELDGCNTMSTIRLGVSRSIPVYYIHNSPSSLHTMMFLLSFT